MKFISLHTKNSTIVYKNSICSSATVVVAVFIALSVLVPVIFVSLLSPYSGITENRIVYEQPQLTFQFRSIFLGETPPKELPPTVDDLLVCSTFNGFNERMIPFTRKCAGSKFWSEDFNHDGIVDRVHFQLELDELERPLKNFDLALFFESKLQQKCILSPPAVLTHHLLIPNSEQIKTGTIHLKGEVALKQYTEFVCPFFGHNTKTHFRQVKPSVNDSFYSSTIDINEYQLESLLREIKTNPGYFELQIQETYYKRNYVDENLRLLLDIDVFQIPTRYHLSVWERLGQFWLYFASFFGISFYIMNKLKDFLFSRHIIPSWEIIPWKKIY